MRGVSRWAGYVAHIRQRRGEYRILVWKLEGKRPFGRSRRRWKDNIMDLEVGCGGMDWIELAQGRDRWRCVNEPLGSIKCGEFLNQMKTG